MGKKQIQAQVQIAEFGHIYQGVQTVTGTRVLNQIVTYDGQTKKDSACYTPKEIDYMNRMAEQLLRELVLDSIK